MTNTLAERVAQARDRNNASLRDKYARLLAAGVPSGEARIARMWGARRIEELIIEEAAK